MTRKYKPSVPYEDHLMKDLRVPETAAAYIEAALEEAPEVLLLALRDVARAHGVAKVAKDAKLARENLYKALSRRGNPEFATINRVLHAMGMRLSVSAVSKAA